jgi:hypothetical protein
MRLGIKLARLKDAYLNLAAEGPGAASPLKRYTPTGRDESSENAELRAFFVAILQRPIRCQREHFELREVLVAHSQRSAAQIVT